MNHPQVTLEAHLTYRCSLACVNCNRGCNVSQTHTPDMTMDDLRCAAEITPNVSGIVLIGGEPTLHRHCVEMGKLAKALAPIVRIYSNAHTAASRAVLEELAALGIHNNGGTEKAEAVVHKVNPFISPADYGLTRQPCQWWGKRRCGYSVDHGGMTQCSIGGMIDGILGLGVRSWAWKEIEEPERIKALCRHCGAFFTDWPAMGGPEQVTVRGQQMSPTWAKVLTRSCGLTRTPGTEEPQSR